MRQAGILAAAGIVALQTMVDRLAEDHARARRLADGLRRTPGIVLDPGTPYTNMVFCSLSPEVPGEAAEVARRLALHGVRVGQVGSRRFRLVTHYWIDDPAVDRAVAAFAQVVEGLAV
jgi:threonine aldolase